MSEKKRQGHGYEVILTKNGPTAFEDFEPSIEQIENLQSFRILVVGAGGLGCEILKDLALSGIKDIELIDLDTIDLSNLNRQFLFRMKDIGRSKAQVAAEFIMKKCPDVKVTHHCKKIQEFSKNWYKRFNVVIAGLDNVEARRWLNKTLNDIVEYDEEGNIDISTIIPLIDGGTEGFRGQARLFLPKLTSCFECSLDSMPQGQHFHLCTIASVPRIPEHCIAYAHQIEWPLLVEFKSADDFTIYQRNDENDVETPAKVTLDKDNPEHMTWIYNRSLIRAQQFGIEGVTYKLTQQVVKNIIPAIASTNAAIAAACANEAVKVLTRASQCLDNFFAYNGVNMFGCGLHDYAKLPTCPVCQPPIICRLRPSATLEHLRTWLQQEHKFERPSVFCGDQTLYLANQHETWADQLHLTLSSLITSGKSVIAHDKLGKSGLFLLFFTDSNPWDVPSS